MNKRTDDPQHPGAFLRDLLEAYYLTVTQAADVLGVSRVTLSRLLNENAELSGDMAIRIAKAFGIDLERLIQLQAAYDLSQMRARAGSIHVRRYRFGRIQKEAV